MMFLIFFLKYEEKIIIFKLKKFNGRKFNFNSLFSDFF